MRLHQRTAIILLGPPGSGKTTITEHLAERKDLAPLEMGALLRAETKRNTPLGRKLNTILGEGKLAPTDLVFEVLRQAVVEVKADILLFDGFPRQNDQIKPFFDLSREARLDLKAVLVLHLARETAKKRLSGRRICPNCGATYNIHSEPPQEAGICDRCGAALQQRDDDRPAVIERRFDIYEAETRPVIDYFETNHPDATHTIPAERPLETVIDSIATILKKHEVEAP